jgi:hypothetical protein
MRASLVDFNLDLNVVSEDDIKNMVENVGGTYVNEEQAMGHVKEMLVIYVIPEVPLVPKFAMLKPSSIRMSNSFSSISAYLFSISFTWPIACSSF